MNPRKSYVPVVVGLALCAGVLPVLVETVMSSNRALASVPTSGGDIFMAATARARLATTTVRGCSKSR